MSDNPDFIEHAKQVAKNWTGEEVDADRMLKEFQLFGHHRRAEILDDLDGEMRNADTSNLRRYSRVTSLHRKLQATHRALRDAGR